VSAAAARPPAHAKPGATLAVASIGAFMTSVDIMIVTTAIPVLRESLGGSIGDLEWTMNAYNLAFACLLLTAAGLGDRFGRRRVFSFGLAGFAASSALAALAPGIGVLIAARAVQGAAAALILPLTLTMISEAFPLETRGRAIGIWGGVLGTGGVLGPIIGAVVVEGLGWQWIFWINVPIAVLLIPAARTFITETYGPRQPLDVPGLALASAGFFGLSWGLVQSTNHPWSAAAVVVPILLGLALMSAFLRWEHRTANPMVPLAIFRIRRFSAANGVSFCIFASLAGSVFLMSQYFQFAQHHSPVEAALRFMPWPLPTVFGAPIAGSLAARYGNRPFMIAGMSLQAGAMAWFALVASVHSPYAHLWPPLVLSGVGIALVMPTMSGEAVAAVRAEQMGVASGTNTTVRELGGVFGVALVATIFASPRSYASPAGFVDGFLDAMWACAVFAAAGAALACLADGARGSTAAEPLAEPAEASGHAPQSRIATQ
jgi:EmrB/QacA subfamily drug resistance transporter